MFRLWPVIGVWLGLFVYAVGPQGVAQIPRTDSTELSATGGKDGPAGKNPASVEDRVWTFADGAKVTLKDTENERHIVDRDGRTLTRLNQLEVVRSSTYNEWR